MSCFQLSPTETHYEVDTATALADATAWVSTLHQHGPIL